MSPDLHRPHPDCMVHHMGQDPLSSRTPVRNFRSDISIVCDLPQGILTLKSALTERAERRGEHISRRFGEISERNGRAYAAAIAETEAGSQAAISKEWVSLCLSRAIEGLDATVLSELGCPMAR